MRKKLITLCFVNILCASQPDFGSDHDGTVVVSVWQNNPYAALVIPPEDQWERINQERKMVIEQQHQIHKQERYQNFLRQQQEPFNNLITQVSQTNLNDDEAHNTLHQQMLALRFPFSHRHLTADQKRIMVEHEMPLPLSFMLNIGAWPEYEALVAQKRTRGEVRGEQISDDKKIICYEIVTRFYEVTQQPMEFVKTLIGWANVLGHEKRNVEAFSKALEAYKFCSAHVETGRAREDLYYKKGTALLKMIDFICFTRHEDLPKIEPQKFAEFDLFLREYKFEYMSTDSKQKLSTISKNLSPETQIAVRKLVGKHP